VSDDSFAIVLVVAGEKTDSFPSRRILESSPVEVEMSMRAIVARTPVVVAVAIVTEILVTVGFERSVEMDS